MIRLCHWRGNADRLGHDMFFAPRMPLKPLAALCRRLATALSAGIDLRTIWARETQQARTASVRQRLASVSAAINRGESLTDALAQTGEFFPLLFREMADVGEQAGHQAEVFAQLAEHYEAQVQLRRQFLSAISWPLLQLGAAIVIIGFLIWIMGIVGRFTGTTVDPLGLGLVGNRGLAIYCLFVFAIGALVYFCVHGVSRGAVWTAPVQRGVLQLPVVGPALQTVALARLAWSMHVTLGAGMELRRALRLSLRSTRNARYTDQIARMDSTIAGGNSIYEAFYEAGAFPDDFLDAMHVGEHSGKLVESMARLSGQYREQARAALATLTMVAGFAVWGLVALLIVALIFRLFWFYVSTIRSVMT